MSVHSVAAISAFETLLSLGGETVTVGGSPFTGQVSEIPYDSGLIEGGTAEYGTYTIKLRLSDFTAGTPAQYTAVTAAGKSLVVLSVKRNNGHLELTCGDTAK